MTATPFLFLLLPSLLLHQMTCQRRQGNEKGNLKGRMVMKEVNDKEEVKDREDNGGRMSNQGSERNGSLPV